jgi:hypothetical protein
MRGLRLSFLILFAVAASAQKPCGDTPVFTTCDIAFELSAADLQRHPAPYLTVELGAEFRSPDFKTYKLPAFWDGAGRMVFRISPILAGTWNYRITGNIPALDGKTDTFTAVASSAPPFIQRANVHHWMYTEGLKPHLYLGAAFSPGVSIDGLAARKLTHVSNLLLTPSAFSATGQPDFNWFRSLDQRITEINGKGMVADLILAPSPNDITRTFPTWQARSRLMSYLIARYASFNITWQLVDSWEEVPDARETLKEIGLAIMKLDPYGHPRTSRAAVTSAPLGRDGWMDHSCYGNVNDAIPSIEHQQYNAPQVALLPAKLDPEALRVILWNATVNGETPELSGDTQDGSPQLRLMEIWADVLSRTRFWDLEPYFDLDGGRALANPGVEYLVYVQKPGPIDMVIEKHSYDVYWIDPATGVATKEKKEWKGEAFQGSPPDSTHDWILHLSRDSKKEGMLRSYKFESWEVPVQEPEVSPARIPYELALPAFGETLTVGASVPFRIRIRKPTLGTRRMMFMITGEVVRDGQGYRVLAANADGSLTVPAVILTNPEGVMGTRVLALNAPGKLYILDTVFNVKK